MRLFGDLFERSYNRLVLKFLPGRKISYGKESIQEDRARVETILVMHKTQQRLPIEYRLIAKDHRWAVHDVVVDGINLAQNYRSQVAKILRTSSYEDLVQKMKAKL